MSKDFVQLHNHSMEGSILDGFATIDEYTAEAKKLGQKALGLTDHGTLFGIYEFIEKCHKAGITPVPGMEAYLAPQNPEGAKVQHSVFYGKDGKKAPFDVASNGAYLHQTLWATSEKGLHNLEKLSSLSNEPERFRQKPRIDFDLLAEYSEDLVVATGCPSSEISTRFMLDQDDKAYEFANRLVEVFGKDRVFVEIMNHDMHSDLERKLIPKQLKLAKKMGLKLIATNDAHYCFKDDAIHHEEFLCNQSGSLMSDKTINEGGRRFAFDGDQYYLKSADEMSAIFPEADFPGAISNTNLLAEMAQDVKISYDPHLKPQPKIPTGYNEVQYYKHLISEGFQKRYGNAPVEIKKEAKKRIRKEFDVIYSSDFVGYMLTVREYLEWTRDKYSTRDDRGEILAASIGPGRGCFLPGNIVSTVKGPVPIELIDKDFVLTHEGVFRNVLETFSYDVQNENCVIVQLENGARISCTADHRLMLLDGQYTEAAKLLPGTELFSAENMKEVVAKITPIKYSGKVYDLHVHGVHNYTVGGVIVHNSVGGSIHAYLLGISELDPIKWDLIFERFLSAGRGSTYRITYDDGTYEDRIASDEKTVKISGNTDDEEKRYTYQLKVGDVVEDADDKNNMEKK